MSDKTKRAVFVTRFGAIAASVGSAVGLGNIWRFPFEAGEHGGGAFMLCYIGFILVVGLPVILSEFILGRASRSNAMGAYARFGRSRSWRGVGLLGIIASLMILSFYSVVAGWTLEYTVQSALGAVADANRDAHHARFMAFSTHPWRPVLWAALFLLTNHLVVSRGVTRGIERAANIMMPLLFGLLVAFCIHSLMLPGAAQGLTFLFKPDFGSINSRVLVGALGQAFFSLSLGLGCMLTYASYFSSSTRLTRTAVTIAGLDTLVAILSGVLIFPAVFTYGMNPEAGPALVFEVLPAVFGRMPGGAIWSFLFFLLLLLASLSSTISMSEISIAYFTDGRRMTRRTATRLSTAIALVCGSLCALSFGPLRDVTICGQTVFGLFDYCSNNILLPVGGMLCSIFVGWHLDRTVVTAQLSGNQRTVHILTFCLRYVCPTAIAVVMLDALGIL